LLPTHAGHHHQDSDIFRLSDKAPQRIRPGGIFPALVQVELQRGSDSCGCLLNATLEPRGTGEGDWPQTLTAGVVSKPLLTLLAQVNRIEQVRAGPPDSITVPGTKIRDG
jgi:hypothetical protein